MMNQEWILKEREYPVVEDHSQYGNGDLVFYKRNTDDLYVVETKFIQKKKKKEEKLKKVKAQSYYYATQMTAGMNRGTTVSYGYATNQTGGEVQQLGKFFKSSVDNEVSHSVVNR